MGLQDRDLDVVVSGIETQHWRGLVCRASFALSSINLPASYLHLLSGMDYYPEDLEEQLKGLGYRRTAFPQNRGEYSRRGSQITLWPHYEPNPVRIEIVFERIVRIQAIEPDTSRGLETRRDLVVYGKGTRSVRLIDLLRKKSIPILVLNEDTLEARDYLNLSMNNDWVFNNSVIETHIQSISLELGKTLGNRLDRFFAVIDELMKENYRVELFCRGSDEIAFAMEILERRGIPSRYLPDGMGESGSYVIIRSGDLYRSFRSERYGYAAIRMGDLLVEETRKRLTKRRTRRIPTIREGNLVVHRQHGIGIFRGLEKKRLLDRVQEFARIEYAEGAMLYVPVSGLDQVKPYSAISERRPRLDAIGRSSWKQKIKKAKKAAELLVHQLADLYSSVNTTKRKPYSLPADFDDFVSDFRYEHTEDQKRAISDVVKDLSNKDVPMDRLITGDAGFGKSEIAHIAAYIVAKNRKQVIFLCPSTILAAQHYTKFRERLERWGGRIALLSSFISEREQKKILDSLSRGGVDIIIGTHRLLSADVRPKDPGLLIIDEEQNFGVKQKELFRRRFPSIDILTLSATPIPRTLYMAASGLKNISVISTPPVDRLPVELKTIEGRDEELREIIDYELSRGGQVFYMYNRIKGLRERTDRLKRLLGDGVCIKMAHGRMDRDELELLFWDFVDGRIDVLVSTTIIENGIDIPNANTMIIEGVEKLGLAQLYQLKGRVGRGNRQGRVYLIFDEETAKKRRGDRVIRRVEIIKEFKDPGRAFRIAEADLELRGAGELLGVQQSGGISSVGFHTYLDLVKEAAQRRHGRVTRPPSYVDVEHPFSAYIPEDYIPNPAERLIFYEEIVSSESEGELENIEEEMRSLFGQIPQALKNLFDTVRLKICGAMLGLESVEIKSGMMYLTFWDQDRVDISSLLRFLEKEGGKITPRGVVKVPIDKIDWSLKECIRILKRLKSEFTSNP